MKPPELDYASPESLEEALALLGRSEDAKPLAGGQSLIPLLNFRLASPALLVDLRRVPGLDGVEQANGMIRIGAMVRQRRAEEDAGLNAAVPLLQEALRHVAHPQIRSRGTIGGSLAHGDPAAELPAVLVALDGDVTVRSESGTRRIPARELYTGFLTTSLQPHELLTAVELPRASAGTGAACVEVTRRPGDYALTGALVQVTLGDGRRIDDVRIALFGVGTKPHRAESVEERLRGEVAAPETFAGAAVHAAEGLDPPDDLNAGRDYRRHLARVLVRRGLDLAAERAA